MLTSCTHGQAGTGVTPEHIGQTVQCPACNGKLQVTAPAQKRPPRVRTKLD